MGKLPYIRDKKMYAAVMGACSYILAELRGLPRKQTQKQPLKGGKRNEA